DARTSPGVSRDRMVADSLLTPPSAGERSADAPALSPRIAPPYAVISNEQRRRYAAADPHNIVHLILPEAAGDANRYRAAAAQLAEWRAAGVFVRDPGPSVYVVAQEFQTPAGARPTHVGLFAAAATQPYLSR